MGDDRHLQILGPSLVWWLERIRPHSSCNYMDFTLVVCIGWCFLPLSRGDYFWHHEWFLRQNWQQQCTTASAKSRHGEAGKIVSRAPWRYLLHCVKRTPGRSWHADVSGSD